MFTCYVRIYTISLQNQGFKWQSFPPPAPMPDVYRRTKDEYHLPKGVSNRNKGLDWILKNGVDNAVVYFAGKCKHQYVLSIPDLLLYFQMTTTPTT